jgi:hypothetical protein
VAVDVAAIEVRARAEAMLPQPTHQRVILLQLQQMVPLPQAVEVLEAAQAVAVVEAVDVAGGEQHPNLLFLKPLKLR